MSDFTIKLTKDYVLDDLFDLQKDVVEIAPDFTLRDLIRLAWQAQHNYPDLGAAFGCRYINKFWEQVNKPPPAPREHDRRLWKLELYWEMSYGLKRYVDDLGEHYRENPKRAEINNLMAFHGVGEPWDEGMSEGHYAVEFSAVNEMKDLPITARLDVDMYPPWVPDGQKVQRSGMRITIYPTLWTLLTSVFFELTFCGQLPMTSEEDGE